MILLNSELELSLGDKNKGVPCLGSFWLVWYFSLWEKSFMYAERSCNEVVTYTCWVGWL